MSDILKTFIAKTASVSLLLCFKYSDSNEFWNNQYFENNYKTFLEKWKYQNYFCLFRKHPRLAHRNTSWQALILVVYCLAYLLPDTIRIERIVEWFHQKQHNEIYMVQKMYKRKCEKKKAKK